MDLPIDYTKANWRQRKKAREQYVVEQNNICCHCGGKLDENPPQRIRNKRIDWSLFPPNFTKYPVHLHHSHDTGMTIGAVHSYCNAVLWQYHGE